MRETLPNSPFASAVFPGALIPHTSSEPVMGRTKYYSDRSTTHARGADALIGPLGPREFRWVLSQAPSRPPLQKSIFTYLAAREQAGHVEVREDFDDDLGRQRRQRLAPSHGAGAHDDQASRGPSPPSTRNRGMRWKDSNTGQVGLTQTR